MAVVPRQERVLCKGWLEHKSHTATGKHWKTLWLVLRGNVIYIFEDQTERDEIHIGCLTIDEKSTFKVIKGDLRDGYKFELTTGPRTNKFRTKKKVEREKWRAYITGISKGRLPSDLDLLDDDINRIKSDINRTGNRISINLSMNSGDSGVIDMVTEKSSSGSGSIGSKTLNDGGPTMRHIFYHGDHINGPARVPSWFFSNCPRPLAEAILASGSAYGNTLMRESTSHSQSGSYVISKRVNRDVEPFEHYEVKRTAQGYKVNVENEHSAMKCLDDVMTYFKKTSGLSETLPMTTNNLAVLGVDVPDYATRIPIQKPATPWMWPPGGEQPPADYEQPQVESSRSNGTPISRTVNASYLRRAEPYQLETGHHTLGAQRRPINTVTMEEIEQRGREAAGLRDLDAVISGFEDPIYENDISDERDDFQLSLMQTPDVSSSSLWLPPPPPEPHMSSINQRYVNENQDILPSDPAPPPPPPPPPPSTAVSAPDVDLPVTEISKQSPRRVVFGPPPVAPKPIRTTGRISIECSKPSLPEKINIPASPTDSLPIALPPPNEPPMAPILRPVTQTNWNNIPGDQSPTAPASRAVSFPSKQQIKHSVSFDSAGTVPEWQRASNTVRQPSFPENTQVERVQPQPAPIESGVDDKHPGGVGTLRDKFSKMTVNNPVKGEHHVQFQGVTRERRATLPTLSIPQDHFSGCSMDDSSPTLHKNPEFRHKLEGIIGPSGPKNAQHPMPKTSIEDDDRVYQEIPPDGVYYANEKFNR